MHKTTKMLLRILISDEARLIKASPPNHIPNSQKFLLILHRTKMSEHPRVSSRPGRSAGVPVCGRYWASFTLFSGEPFRETSTNRAFEGCAKQATSLYPVLQQAMPTVPQNIQLCHFISEVEFPYGHTLLS